MEESSQSVVKVIRCIICPTGCAIQAVGDGKGNVTFDGYTCKRGLEYAEQEYYEPKRILTTTMRVENGLLPLIPVRTNKPIPKDKLKDVLEEIAKKILKPPIKMGDILIENVLGLDANIIASRDLIKNS
jgi:CxxC motif-containing protein